MMVIISPGEMPAVLLGVKLAALGTPAAESPGDNCAMEDSTAPGFTRCKGAIPERLYPVVNPRDADSRSSAGINRHVVGNERVLQERRKRIHPGPESCGGRREVFVEA